MKEIVAVRICCSNFWYERVNSIEFKSNLINLILIQIID